MTVVFNLNLPRSSARLRSSVGSVNSSALNGMAPSADKETKDRSVFEKQMWPADTRLNSTSEYLSIVSFKICAHYRLNKVNELCTYVCEKQREEKHGALKDCWIAHHCV